MLTITNVLRIETDDGLLVGPGTERISEESFSRDSKTYSLTE